MFTGLNYEPDQVPEDHFFPITMEPKEDRRVHNIEVAGATNDELRASVERFREELKQKRVPSAAPKTNPVYIPQGIPDCYVEKATALPSWSRERDVSCTTDRDTEFHVLRRIKYRMEQIERIDRRTWGLYYGALDIWSYVVYAFDKITDVVNAIRTLGMRRFRSYWGRKVKNLAEKIGNERKENRKARSG